MSKYWTVSNGYGSFSDVPKVGSPGGRDFTPLQTSSFSLTPIMVMKSAVDAALKQTALTGHGWPRGIPHHETEYARSCRSDVLLYKVSMPQNWGTIFLSSGSRSIATHAIAKLPKWDPVPLEVYQEKTAVLL
ncbi:hypothetical protein TGRH88_027390 [Toxoplasma gondii]|uniref:Uncharacterized protein n=1 Tax=Toxoplasma gondii TaxID=5811 RepID=A0A7J6K965_TOXGO|nr:hypothetical protein TGRH88_027390 [Toxoplasma gondii]